MTKPPDYSPRDGRVRERLIQAADAEIAASGDASPKIEAVASRAGVSRATAYRQLGTISEMLVQVALLRARRHVRAVESLMAEQSGVLAKFEAALVYATRELPRDPTMATLIAHHSASIHDPRVLDVALALTGPVLQTGVRNGEIRPDLPIGDLARFLVEQTYLAAGQPDRSEEAVAQRFLHFITPVLTGRGQSDDCVSSTTEHEYAMLTAIEAVENLRLRDAVTPE
jgi:AcrR family transcriptional regulator